MFHFRVRNGTGWGHQAMTTRLRSVAGALRMLLVLLALTACPGRHVVACGLCFLLFLRLAVFAALPALCFQQADIRVARGVFLSSMRLLSLKVIKRFIKGLSPRV